MKLSLVSSPSRSKVRKFFLGRALLASAVFLARIISLCPFWADALSAPWHITDYLELGAEIQLLLETTEEIPDIQDTGVQVKMACVLG